MHVRTFEIAVLLAWNSGLH